MRIIIDGMGGDFAPLEPLRGAAEAVRELGVEMIVTGGEAKLRACAGENGIPLDGITFVDAPRVIPMEAEPTSLLKEYSDCSMAVGMKMVADGEGDAFVSAGSTGALLVGATFLVKRIKGVKRPAIGTMIPAQGGRFYLLCDAGANHDCRPEMLTQFAVMGSSYYEKIIGTERPRVGLINIGAEETKGTELQVAALPLLKNLPGIHFIGNVEARDLPLGGCDVAVCDGFTGNIVLKLTEGMGKFIGGAVKEVLMHNLKTKLGALLIASEFGAFKKTLDYKETGGAPILGVTRPVIKAHGSSDARAFKNAIRQAKSCVERDVSGAIEAGVARQKAAARENV